MTSTEEARIDDVRRRIRTAWIIAVTACACITAAVLACVELFGLTPALFGATMAALIMIGMPVCAYVAQRRAELQWLES